MILSDAYGVLFDRVLREVAEASGDPDLPLVPFWPLRGASYDRELLVIDRSVNGWVDDWTARQLRDATMRLDAVEQVRRDAEPDDRDRMAWVTDLWGATTGYSTRRSAFWRVLRRIGANDGPSSTDWSSRLVWTNLYKVSPGAGWNPGGNLQRAQRATATQLLRIELETFAPRRVLALTGDWIRPFMAALGLDIELRTGLVEGVGHRGDCAWVVAKHPMTKPEDRFVGEVLAAFADLGAPLGDTGHTPA